ncbi:uncharacterized protein PAN0_003c1937 [Moesziomyces antarcticus]|uniref:Peptidase S9 prolyl oligopeptidase catalytic domain-containing protein n=1 Tax=Pseudozyma antarctica TaxID=84753 RepID=A0A5C3FLJ3_PSEA2|nr:uncharacterized protein PAN0_003c1937 [Moesziomyces antarcticus]GAK63729.1 transmembrane protein [Moesziomyces antarcticus]SPO44329.1 uncharacterized protein PSANT_02014 [Moesziomyces antarcticus]
MLCHRLALGLVTALLVTYTVSTQHVFQQEPQAPAFDSAGKPALQLDTTWQVLGPFPAGMRELPFGGFPASPAPSMADLLLQNAGQDRYFTPYGTANATSTSRTFSAQVQAQDVRRVRHTLTIEYPDADWAWLRKSAGWSALQWQMIASTTLEIGQNNTAVAVTMDKTAEFAIVPMEASGGNSAQAKRELDRQPLEWHTGDWYSYIAAFSKEDAASDRLPISHHLLHLDQGSYTLLVRSMYEIRIFGDPRNNGGQESPRMVLGIDLAARALDDVTSDEVVEIHTDPHHSNVPHVVGGWLAGWGLSFGVRNLHPTEVYTLESIDVQTSFSGVEQPPIAVKLGIPLTLSPSQTLVVPIKLNQSGPLDVSNTTLDLSLMLRSAAGDTINKAVSIPLVHKDAFWDASRDDQDHHAYMYSYLAPDHTVQLAAATPPRKPAAASTNQSALPPLMLTLHGAGVDVRDLFFSNSIRRQDECWSILPTGRTPWGYDWQLASFQAADAAVDAFHQHLYGLPPTMSDAERQKWQFDPRKLFIMGHSNGGQGAWYRLSRYPDRVIAGVVAATYTKVSDYVSFAWKVGRHYADPALHGVLHSSLSMFENDLFASNLAGIDLLIKYGSADANVPPWNSKDMAMLVDGWNKRSGVRGKVRVSEVPGRPHWWDTLFSEDDVQSAIETACTSSKNPGYAMPEAPQSFTLTVANPAEAGPKGGWQITEVEVPGRLARLQVQYTVEESSEDAVAGVGHVKLHASNAKRFHVQLEALQSSPALAFGNASAVRITLNGQAYDVDIEGSHILAFEARPSGEWHILASQTRSTDAPAARPIGPLLRIVSTAGPMALVVPTEGPATEVAMWKRVAQRFAADLLLYAGINSQIVADTDSAALAETRSARHLGNVVAFGGPRINSYSRTIYYDWPTKHPIHFVDPESSAQFRIQGRHFYENGTALLTLAPHPELHNGLAMVVHGIGTEGITRAARLLPTRTATMIPEWIVVDSTAEWMGEGGVQAAGWYDAKWGWSEGMSYVQ